MEPSPHLARTLFAEPGHVISTEDGVRWRWNGTRWEPLQPGDTVLHPDRVTWQVWTGTTLEPAELAPGALVRVTWHRDGVDWDNQLCTLEATEEIEGSPDRWFLVTTWPTTEECAVVLNLAVELVAPPVPKDEHR